MKPRPIKVIKSGFVVPVVKLAPLSQPETENRIDIETILRPSKIEGIRERLLGGSISEWRRDRESKRLMTMSSAI